MQRSVDCGVPSPSRYIYSRVPTSMDSGTSQKRGQKAYKSQNIRKSSVKQYLTEMAT